jgi:hypothetical protein
MFIPRPSPNPWWQILGAAAAVIGAAIAHKKDKTDEAMNASHRCGVQSAPYSARTLAAQRKHPRA